MTRSRRRASNGAAALSGLAAYALANGIAFAETAGKPLESLPRGMLTEASVRQAGCGAALTPRM